MSVKRAIFESIAKPIEKLEPAWEEIASGNATTSHSEALPKEAGNRLHPSVPVEKLDKSAQPLSTTHDANSPEQEGKVSGLGDKTETPQAGHSSKPLPADDSHPPSPHQVQHSLDNGAKSIPHTDEANIESWNAPSNAGILETLVHQILDRRRSPATEKIEDRPQPIRSRARVEEMESRLRQVEMRQRLQRET
jgi:hypothetical protein